MASGKEQSFSHYGLTIAYRSGMFLQAKGKKISHKFATNSAFNKKYIILLRSMLVEKLGEKFLRAASRKYLVDLEIAKNMFSPNSPRMKPYCTNYKNIVLSSLHKK